MNISAVIVCVPQHLKFLPSLITNLQSQSIKFSEFILVTSGFKRRHYRKIDDLLKTYKINLIKRPLSSAGSNRNAGWKEANSELVAFLDADDLYAPERNKFILDVFSMHNIYLFLHSYFVFDEQNFDTSFFPNFISNSEIYLSNEFRKATPTGIRSNKYAEIKISQTNTNLNFNDSRKEFPIHHAHAVVKTDLRNLIQYPELLVGARNEDGIFARDLLEIGEIGVSPLKLSAYRKGSSANVKRYLSFKLF